MSRASGPVLVVGAAPAKGTSKHAVYVANPVRAMGRSCNCPNKAKRNPAKCRKVSVPKGKLKPASRAKLPACAFADPKHKKYPIHDAGHAMAALPRLAAEHKRGNVSAAEYKLYRGRILEARKRLGIAASRQQNPAASSAAQPTRKSPMKRRRTAAQKAATKRMLAANKSRSRNGRKHNPSKKATTAEKKAAKALGVTIKELRASPDYAAALAKKAPKRKPAAKKPAAKRKPARKPAAKKPAAKKHSRKRGYSVRSVKRSKSKKPAKVRYYKSGPKKGKKIPKRAFGGTFINTKTGRKIRLSPIRRKHNPMFSTGNVVTFAGTGALGLLLATMTDRWIATSNGDAAASYGADAWTQFSHGANWKRLVASGVPAGVFGITGGLLAYYNRTGWASASLGLGFGYALKFIPQATMRLLGYAGLYDVAANPAVDGYKGYLNRLLPEGSSTNNDPNVVAGAYDPGPRALGVGKCGCGCGRDAEVPQGATCGSPKAQPGVERQPPPRRAPPSGGGIDQSRIPPDGGIDQSRIPPAGGTPAWPGALPGMGVTDQVSIPGTNGNGTFRTPNMPGATYSGIVRPLRTPLTDLISRAKAVMPSGEPAEFLK